jgi:type II secretory pathway pseudopilin PulG
MICHPRLNPTKIAGFTLVEAVVAIALVGIGVSTTIAALTKFNAFASTSRNSTGAYTVAMNQIDAIQSATPFSPNAVPAQIPAVLAIGTRNANTVVYQDTPTNTIVPGIIQTTVADASVGGVIMYRATVTVSWQYLGRPYSLSMSTVRASDQ